jgi:site-specific DNA-methyltransferase (adenine-specific)
MSKKRRTTTSPFGTAGRVNHDSAPFYAGRLYLDQPQESQADFVENHLRIPDRIYCHTSEDMAELPDNCIHLMNLPL